MKTDLLHEIQIPTDRKITIEFQHPHGTLFSGDSLQWLKTLASESVDLVFADPPYNLKKAEWDFFASQEAYIDWSLQWIQETARILKATGSIYIMGFSEILADLKHPAAKYFPECRWLVWHYKNKANLGNDWGRSHESILHFRKQKSTKINIDNIRIPYGEHTLKYPARSQAITSQYNSGKQRGKQIDDWTPNPKGAKPKDVIEVPTTCNGMNEKTRHPTQKPEELVRKFILASSQRGDTVVDPFSGSGTALVAAEQLGRHWLGCEINPEYNQWAVQRLKQAKQMTDEEWFLFDRQRQKRRQQIR